MRTAAEAEVEGFVTRPWGGFETIEEGAGYKVKRLVVEPGGRLSLQRHRHRAESWIVVSGTPRVIVSGRTRRLRAREMVNVPRGAWHRIENHGRVRAILIEVQHGLYLGEDDIIRRQDDYGRADGRDASPSRARARRGALRPRAASTSSRSRSRADTAGLRGRPS